MKLYHMLSVDTLARFETKDLALTPLMTMGKMIKNVHTSALFTFYYHWKLSQVHVYLTAIQPCHDVHTELLYKLNYP